MSNHQASEQMLGYLYQVRYALFLLLNNDNSDCQISIEKFDDVAFSNNDIPTQLIQLKHHIHQQGNLTDASTDMWRTLKVWIDAVNESPDILSRTIFLIITTASAPGDSAAFFLKSDNNRDPGIAYAKLKKVCSTSTSQANNRYYSTFTSVSEDIVKQLVKQIYVIDCASNVINVEKDIIKQIRYSCVHKYQKRYANDLKAGGLKKQLRNCALICRFL